MRLHLQHDIELTWPQPTRGPMQILRLAPTNHSAQHVLHWHVQPNADCILTEGEDALGNTTYTCTIEGHTTNLTIHIEGDIATQDTAGMIRNVAEKFPPALYLRETDLTQPGPLLQAFAHKQSRTSLDSLEQLHLLMKNLHEQITLQEDKEQDVSPLEKAFETRKAPREQLAHLMIAAARILKFPARFISGYLINPYALMIHEDISSALLRQHAKKFKDESAILHSWMEAYVPDLGWIGFDPFLCICPQESHIRLAAGLDAMDAMAIRCAPTAHITHNIKAKYQQTLNDE